MSKVVIVGDIYYADLYPDQGLPPSQGGRPSHPIHYPGAPSQPIYHPGHPDHGLPSQPGTPEHPIYHPGHPDHGLPAYPDQGLPGGGSGSAGSPSHPIHIPGVPDQGLPPGQEIPPDQITDPDLPEEYDNDLVVAVKQPGGEEWTYTAYTVAPDQGQPQPTPTPATQSAPRPPRRG